MEDMRSSIEDMKCLSEAPSVPSLPTGLVRKEPIYIPLELQFEIISYFGDDFATLSKSLRWVCKTWGREVHHQYLHRYRPVQCIIPGTYGGLHSFLVHEALWKFTFTITDDILVQNRTEHSEFTVEGREYRKGFDVKSGPESFSMDSMESGTGFLLNFHMTLMNTFMVVVDKK
ncbi:hypothetical protein ABW19_dt0204478 [Dactylella cylindrospora]|nr:hypothetical protein ABW19_dt0204478 [Dactylella cylindrospora]